MKVVVRYGIYGESLGEIDQAGEFEPSCVRNVSASYAQTYLSIGKYCNTLNHQYSIIQRLFEDFFNAFIMNLAGCKRFTILTGNVTGFEHINDVKYAAEEKQDTKPRDPCPVVRYKPDKYSAEGKSSCARPWRMRS